MAKKKVSKKKTTPKKPAPKDGVEPFPPAELVRKEDPPPPELPRGPTPEEKQEAVAKVQRCLKRAEGLVGPALERVASECRHNLTNDAHVRNYLRIEEEHLTHELVRTLMSKLTQVKAEDCR